MTKIVSSHSAGQPGAPKLQRNWPLRPIRFFKQRSIKRTMVNDPADGRTQPEFRNILGGVSLRTSGVAIHRQQPNTPPAPNAGTTTIKPARQGRLRRR